MPTYQYMCTECGHAFEKFQSFSEDSLTSCPECTGRLRKLFNSVGVVFKGSGFYKTDSRTSDTSSPAASTTSSGGDSSSGSSSSGSSEGTGSSSSTAAAAAPAS